MRKKNKTILLIIRLFIIALLFSLAFEPKYISYIKKNKPEIAVLIDTSFSMNFNNRLLKIKKFFLKNFDCFQKYFSINLYQFSSNAAWIDKQNLKDLKPTGKFTDIKNSVLQVSSLKEKIDAIFIFSDGQHNATSDINTLDSLNIPVYTIYPVEKQPITDVSITEIRASDYTFKNIPFELNVVIYSYNLNGREITMYLKENKEIISIKKININENGYKNINFSFTPINLGLHTYTVDIPPLPEETITSNNKYSFNVEVIREKTRIMYICGQPSPEYYFLRNLLKSNPAIELVSFVILRNPESIAVVSDEQLSLIPFPADEIFSKDIFDYDILIFENFNYTKFRIYTPYLENIKKFVKENGKGFLMIGGDNGFGKGGYIGSPIEEIIPVEMDTPEEPIEEGPFKLKVLQPQHPIMSITDNITDTQRIWNNEMPELDSCQKLRPKKGTNILAVHPFKKISDNNIVVIACAEYQKGRTVAIGSNTTWRWALQKEDNKYYINFWTNLIKWLNKEEETKNFRISITQKKYFVRDKINIKLILLDKQMKNAFVKLYVRDPYFKIKEIFDIIPSYYGWKVDYILPEIGGEYVFDAKLTKFNNIVASDQHKIFVNDQINTEQLNLELNIDLLNKIANMTGGKLYNLDEFNIKKIYEGLNKTVKPVIKKQIDISDISWIYFVIIFLFIIEWILLRLY